MAKSVNVTHHILVIDGKPLVRSRREVHVPEREIGVLQMAWSTSTYWVNEQECDGDTFMYALRIVQFFGRLSGKPAELIQFKESDPAVDPRWRVRAAP